MRQRRRRIVQTGYLQLMRTPVDTPVRLNADTVRERLARQLEEIHAKWERRLRECVR